MRPIYYESFLADHLDLFHRLMTDLEWIDLGLPRKEYFMATESDLTYIYGKQTEAPVYKSHEFHPLVEEIRLRLNKEFSCDYNVCFLNRYDSGNDFLGWHSDSSKEMNSSHDIAVISLGEMAREIWWKKPADKGIVPSDNRQLLAPGSCWVMPKGFQQLYVHRIPKSDRQDMKSRISLTFRNYLKEMLDGK